MGLSGGSTQKTSIDKTSKPVYESQIMGAYNNVNDAFNSNKGNVDAIQGMLGGLLPQAQANYANNPTLNAAKGYVTDTLGSTYQQNPFLDGILSQTAADTANRTATAMGTRGGLGGSAMAKLVSGQVANAENNLRYNDYNNWEQRRAQAAAMAPGLSSADATNLSGLLGLSDSAANLKTDNALKQALGVGSLLGGYTHDTGTETTKTSGGGLGGLLGGVLSTVAGKLVDKIKF